jgi:hypothetical protein
LLKHFETLSQINKQFGHIHTMSKGSQKNNDRDSQLSKKLKVGIIPENKKYFERFFEIKQEIKLK